MKLVYFSWIRERLDCAEESVDLPEHVKTIADLLAWQKSRGDIHADIFQHDKVVRVALNQQHEDNRNTLLEGAEEIAFFPPMTGG